MALPAGRYGVTKNQLLKIKKLPMNTIKLIEELTEKFDLLGTAAFKNSTSVVTESSDLVESGAVFDALGFGNKNLLNNTLSKTENGLTVTAQSDGSCIINGTYTGSTGWFVVTSVFRVKANKSYRMFLGDYPTDKINAVGFNGYGQQNPIYPTDDFSTNLRININNGVTFNNLHLYPMICYANVTDWTFEPYHASVEESLAEKTDNTVIAPVENGSTASQAYAVGEHFIRDGAFCTCKQAISQGGSFTLNTNYTAGDVASCLVKQATFSGTTNTSGDIKLSTDDIAILGVKLTTMVSRLATVYYISSGSNAGAWVHIIERDGTDSANTSVSGTYYYI